MPTTHAPRISANSATADRNTSTNKKRPIRPSQNVSRFTSIRQGKYALATQASDYSIEIGGTSSFEILPGSIQHPGKLQPKLSVGCDPRCAPFRYRGPVRFNYNLDLCVYCYRAAGCPVAKVSGE